MPEATSDNADNKDHPPARPGRRAAGDVNPAPSKLQRNLIHLAAITFVVAWWYAATLDWRAEREAERILDREVSPRDFTRIPLASEPLRRAAQVMMVADNPDYAYIDALLGEAIDKRPLWAPYWLDRAGAAHQAGNNEDAVRYAARAVKLWPTRHVLLWKAAMLYTRMGRSDDALRTLNRYLNSEPGGYRQTVAVASRLQPEPARMLQAVLPDELPHGIWTRDELVHRILRDARYREDTPLGAAAWRELSPDAQRDHEIAGFYVEWMAAVDHKAEALRAWGAHLDTDNVPLLENGGFEQALLGGLGWRLIEQKDVTVTRDAQHPVEGLNTLKVEFNGNENAHYQHLRQYLPVEPGRQYAIDYTWRGERITTRSGPYLAVHSDRAGRIARTDHRWGSWQWTRERLEFTAPETGHFVELRLRRDKTDALDNKIAGTLWLDDFTMKKASLSLRERARVRATNVNARSKATKQSSNRRTPAVPTTTLAMSAQ